MELWKTGHMAKLSSFSPDWTVKDLRSAYEEGAEEPWNDLILLYKGKYQGPPGSSFSNRIAQAGSSRTTRT